MRPTCSEDVSPERSLSRSYLADAASIPAARGELATFAQAQGATPSQVDDIALSSSEALTNVVAHAYTEPGGRIHARSTTVGAPFSSRNDTSASPTASSVMAFSVSIFGLVRRVCAAVATAF